MLFKQSCICSALCSNTHTHKNTLNDSKCVLEKKEVLLFGCKMELGAGFGKGEDANVKSVCLCVFECEYGGFFPPHWLHVFLVFFLCRLDLLNMQVNPLHPCLKA